MIVDKEEWDSGRGKNTLKSQICESLERNYPNALTMNEIFDDIELKFDWEKHPILSFLGAWGLNSVFDELVKEGGIELKIIKGKGTHYRFNK